MKAVCQALQRNLSRPIVKNRAAFLCIFWENPQKRGFYIEKVNIGGQALIHFQKNGG